MTAPPVAVLLAAGFGQRLRPLTDLRPKALVPFFGIPLIQFGLAALIRSGVRDIAVNAHHLAATLTDYLAAHAPAGATLTLSREAEILGTGGALVRLQSLIGTRPCLVVNADVFHSVDLGALLRAHAAGMADATVAVTRDAAHPELELVHFTPAGRVVHVGPTPPGGLPAAPERGVFSGVHLVGPALRRHLPAAGFSCVVRAGYVPLLAAGGRVEAFDARAAHWFDLGTPASYLEAHLRAFAALPELAAVGAPWRLPAAAAPGVWRHPTAIVGSGARLVPPVLLCERAQIGRGAQVGPAVVLGAGARIENRVRVAEAVLWENAVLDRDLRRGIVAAHLVVSVR